MINSRSLGAGVELYQIIEFHGPTHDAQWMLPGVEAEALRANTTWLSPEFWMPRTNRLVFTFQLWVIKASDRIIIVDTGVGNAKHRVAPSQNMLNNPIIDWLEAIGAAPEEVTAVVHTHLHGDHVGWNTQLVSDRWEPTFPNATYYIPRVDWEAYTSRLERGVLPPVFAAPMVDSVIPIVDAGLAKFIDPGNEVAGLIAHSAPGHTPGNLVYSFENQGDEYLFTGDVIHSPMQILRPDINSRWCEIQDDARSSRAWVLGRAATNNSTIIPAHAKGMLGWHIGMNENKYTLDIAR